MKLPNKREIPVTRLLGSKIIIATLIISALLLLLGYHGYTQYINKDRYLSAKTQYGSFYSAISSMLRIGDYGSMYTTAEIFANSSQVVAVDIVDTDGKQLLKLRYPDRSAKQKFVFSRPIIDDAITDSNKGLVKVEYAATPIPREEAQPAFNMSLFAFSCVLGLIFLSTYIYFAIKFDIARPVNQLRKKVSEGANADLENVKLLRIRGAIEFRDLARSINAITTELVDYAIYDPLTGLYNRRQIMLMLQNAIGTHEYRRPLRIFYIDIDGFKYVNDQFGHALGDKVIASFANSLKSIESDNVVCGRIGGDEFIAIEFHFDPSTSTLVRQLLKIADCRIDLPNLNVNISNCIGSAVYPKDGLDSDTLMHHADIALYEAKKNGVAQHLAFNARLIEAHSQRQKAIYALRDIYKKGVVRHAFQPIVHAKDSSTAGYEALLRVKDELGNLIPPDILMEVAQRMGNQPIITDYTIANAVHFLNRQTKNEGCFVSINLNRQQLLAQDLPDKIYRALAEFDLDPSRLVVEVTEESILSDGIMIKALQNLTRFGIQLALDDFGRGYSSLYCLNYLPIGYLKIDRSLVVSIPTDSRAQNLLTSVVRIAEGLQIDVIAEGIENESLLQLINHMGCTYAQGYHIARPALPEHVLTDNLDFLYPIEEKPQRDAS